MGSGGCFCVVTKGKRKKGGGEWVFGGGYPATLVGLEVVAAARAFLQTRARLIAAATQVPRVRGSPSAVMSYGVLIAVVLPHTACPHSKRCRPTQFVSSSLTTTLCFARGSSASSKARTTSASSPRRAMPQRRSTCHAGSSRIYCCWT